MHNPVEGSSPRVSSFSESLKSNSVASEIATQGVRGSRDVAVMFTMMGLGEVED